MKLASLPARSRDGELVVVNRALTSAVRVADVPTLQFAIEHWAQVEPTLQATYAELQTESHSSSFPFDASTCWAPFPRAFQFLDGSVYLHHMQKARAARGVAMPPRYETEPLMYQGMSHRFLAPREPLQVPDDGLNVDFEGEIAIVTDDVPMGVTAVRASEHIKLFVLLNDFTLRVKTKLELPKQFGFLQAKPINALAPVAVTPDELGESWDGRMPNINVTSKINGEWFGAPNAAVDYWFDYPTLIAHAAATRDLSAGTLIGAGTVSNASEASGYGSISEATTDQKLGGKPVTPFLKYGDVVTVEVLDAENRSLFGKIETEIRPG